LAVDAETVILRISAGEGPETCSPRKLHVKRVRQGTLRPASLVCNRIALRRFCEPEHVPSGAALVAYALASAACAALSCSRISMFCGH
jgi:hypothetical protein